MIAAVRPVFARLRPPRPGPIVLLYHQIGEVADDRWELAVSPTHFAEQMDVLRRRRRPVSLARLEAGMREGALAADAAAITFDDGYADNLRCAKPVLDRWAVPATVFVVAGAIGQAREFWWDELERLLFTPDALPPRLELRVAGRDRAWSVRSTGNGRWVLLRSLWRLLRTLPAEERTRTLGRIGAWTGAPPAVRPDRRVLTVEELRRLAAGGLVEIGAHTETHPLLGALPVADQRAEVARGKACLETILGAPVARFAYPFGGRLDVAAGVAAVRDAGFTLACTTRPGVVRPDGDPFRVPRLVVGDWDGDAFARWLARWG